LLRFAFKSSEIADQAIFYPANCVRSPFIVVFAARSGAKIHKRDRLLAFADPLTQTNPFEYIFQAAETQGGLGVQRGGGTVYYDEFSAPGKGKAGEFRSGVYLKAGTQDKEEIGGLGFRAGGAAGVQGEGLAVKSNGGFERAAALGAEGEAARGNQGSGAFVGDADTGAAEAVMYAGGAVDFDNPAASGFLVEAVYVLGDHGFKNSFLFQRGQRVVDGGRCFLVDSVDQGAGQFVKVFGVLLEFPDTKSPLRKEGRKEARRGRVRAFRAFEDTARPAESGYAGKGADAGSGKRDAVAGSGDESAEPIEIPAVFHCINYNGVDCKMPPSGIDLAGGRTGPWPGRRGAGKRPHRMAAAFW
jgi:hypothetical protein